jgi:hypothetical protein
VIEDLLTGMMGDLAKSLEYRRRGANWYRTTAELYTVVNLQKSSWGGRSYVNFGYCDAREGQVAWVAESRCQVRFRAEAIGSFQRSEGSALLVEDSGLSRDEYASGLRDRLYPALESAMKLNSIQELAEFLSTAIMGSRVFIHRDIRPALAIDDGQVEP